MPDSIDVNFETQRSRRSPEVYLRNRRGTMSSAELPGGKKKLSSSCFEELKKVIMSRSVVTVLIECTIIVLRRTI
jgi:hypothetical protein